MSALVFHCGDSRAVLRGMIARGEFVDSVVCDPPYGLVSVTTRFGKEGSAAAKFGSDGAFSRASAGFMGQAWDGSGIERDPEFWALVLAVLKPGGYCVAFSSPRTGHWQACAMEVAGFVMHPFLGWLYGQGFPKDHDAERAVAMSVCESPGRHYANAVPPVSRHGDHVCETTEESQIWEGWAYGAQSLKPALEPIYVGQRPFTEKNGALNLLRHGVGAMNIDACRAHGEDAQGGAYTIKRLGADNNKNGTWKQDREFTGYQQPGRHPANLLHDGSAEVVALFPQSAGQQQQQITGKEPSGKTKDVYGEFAGRTPFQPRGDAGSAARFFNAFPFTEADYEALAAEGIIVDLETGVVCYQGKATKADRAGSKHPTVKPIALIRWLCRLVTPPGGTVLDPFAGSGTTGQAALDEGFRPILIEMNDQYADDIRRRFDLPAAFADDVLELLDGECDLIG